MIIVAKVGVQDTLLFQREAYEDYLRPLLLGGLGDLKKLSHNTSNICKTSEIPEGWGSEESLNEDTDPNRFRESHLEKWNQRFQDLIEFREEFGHCLVPLEWPLNPSLSHWVKRQRCQYKAKREGKHSTLTDERQET
jgi:hypothetical protein